MAGLPDLLAWLDNKRRVAGRNLSDLMSNPSGYAEMIDDRAGQYNRNVQPVAQGGSLSNRPMTEEEIQQKNIDMAMNVMPMGVGQIAYHGSPHKFDKFRSEAIGTGEGAQAYGHGLYLAEAPGVAQEYAKTLSDQASKALAGKSGIEKALRKYEDMLKLPDDKMPIKRSSAEMLASQYRKELDDFLAKAPDMATPQLYKTDIPDEAVARMLDWDKPLSQQAEILAQLQKSKNKQIKAMLDFANKEYQSVPGEFPTAGEAFKLMSMNHTGRASADSAKASALLAKQGIPGIRYLDGGSRSAGQGSSNFVAFDPEMIRILERNGVATGAKPWAPGEYGLKDLIGRE